MESKVLDAIYKRRSVRNYQEKQIPPETIQALLVAAAMAPSARDRQPAHFTIVEGAGNLKQLAKEALARHGRIKAAAILSTLKLRKTDSIFYNAPVLIIISGPKGQAYLHDDLNLAAQNLMLAAHSMGLGTCYIGLAMPLNTSSGARKELGIPDSFEIVAPIICGYPATQEKHIPERRPKILKWLKSA
jgi:nitroreductase